MVNMYSVKFRLELRQESYFFEMLTVFIYWVTIDTNMALKNSGMKRQVWDNDAMLTRFNVVGYVAERVV